MASPPEGWVIRISGRGYRRLREVSHRDHTPLSWTYPLLATREPCAWGALGVRART